ncbi:hypothetical protein MARPU_13310 [Marichromatium purpuratum 984]|uniref:Uncharacterized protein n=2 Tax=Marichromatium purpuratum TaxID=37487 RepID=W0E4C6_MARPU|nr:hypothetical protein MARPU_13310 [Marichromatium purpuratum 984]
MARFLNGAIDEGLLLDATERGVFIVEFTAAVG